MKCFAGCESLLEMSLEGRRSVSDEVVINEWTIESVNAIGSVEMTGQYLSSTNRDLRQVETE